MSPAGRCSDCCMHRGLSFSEEMPTTTRCCVWHAQEKAGAKLSQKQAGLLGCLVPPLELVVAAGCYQPLCQSAPTAVHWWCLLLEPLGEPWWCFGGVTHLNPGCSLASPTHSTASRVLVTPGSDKCGQTRSAKALATALAVFLKAGGICEISEGCRVSEAQRHYDNLQCRVRSCSVDITDETPAYLKETMSFHTASTTCAPAL